MSTLAKASVLDKIEGSFSVQEFAIPDPAPGTVLLRTELAGICATDVHMYYGHLNTVRYPISFGHEFCGVIERLGKGITIDARGEPIKEGDRVAVYPAAQCGTCYYCRIAGTPNRCTNVRAYGFTPLDTGLTLTGGWAQYVYLQYPQINFVKTTLPANITVLVEPLTIAAHGIERAQMHLGDQVVIQGAGAIGLGALIFARYAGAAKTIVIGGPKRRLQLAKEFGADVVIDIDEVKDPEERIRIVLGETWGKRGADIVFECAGFPSTLAEGLAMMRNSGRYVEMGHFTDVGPATINPHHHLMRKNVDLFGVWGANMRVFLQGLSLMERREYPYEKIVDPIIPLSRVHEGVVAIGKNGWKLEGKEVYKIGIDPWA